jgi:DNA-binding CsgD family transcriptional regulator/GAF domain-containing protein
MSVAEILEETDLVVADAAAEAAVLQLARPRRELFARINETVSAAYAALGKDDRPVKVGQTPAQALDAAFDLVVGAITRPSVVSSAARARCIPLLNELQILRVELAELRATRMLERQDAVRFALSRLRNVADAGKMLDLVPAELCRCDFSRAWLSRLEGSSWKLASCHVSANSRLESALHTACAGSEPLSPGSHEAEMVRRRTAILVEAPDRDVEPKITAVFAPKSYVAAPILVDSRVIGFLHADAGRQMGEEDRQTIALFAEAVGHVIQRVVLLERFEGLRRSVRRITHSIGDLVDDTCWAAVDMTPAQRVAVAGQPAAPAPRSAVPSGGGRESRLASLLTAREIEVLRLMASGETNGGIAGQLVISEGTVKSHVKHILRKLHASNRAQAVSRYLSILHAGNGNRST